MEFIQKEHGNGGKQTYELINKVFKPAFNSEILNKADDSSSINIFSKQVGVTTDSFVVKPYFFKGGDIGKLSVCGTVNDLAVSGFVPKYVTTSFIIEEGFLIEDLKKIVSSIKYYADMSGIEIIAGDTKVVEKGSCDGIFINTTGIGLKEENKNLPDIKKVKSGQVIIVSGDIARHGACIYSHNAELGFEYPIESDCEPLNGIIKELTDGFDISYMKDLTRGGLATALNEIVLKSSKSIYIYEDRIPVSDEVRGLCDILGLDAYYLACEGRFILIVDKKDKDKVLEVLKKYNSFASEIGYIEDSSSPRVFLKTVFGGTRILDMLYYEMLPRIC